MSRYIDADALITDLNKGLWGKDWDKVLAEAIINEAPSIDIVRCKECYMCDEEMWCSFYDSIMESDDFCSYGSRSEKPNNSTISKMEQVDKDINVRSKDEPTWEQVKEYCNKRCLDIVDSAMRKQWYKDEPQTERSE